MDLSKEIHNYTIHHRIARQGDVTEMEEEIRELSERIEDHEERIKELENIIKSKDRKKAIAVKSEVGDVVELFKSLNLSDYDYVYGLSGVVLYLAILHIAKQELNVDGLTPTEISKICKEKIRISEGINRTTISNALRGTGVNVDRISNPRGRGYAYRITSRGESYTQEQIEQ